MSRFGARDAALALALALVALAGLPFGGTPSWWRAVLALVVAAALSLVAVDGRARLRLRSTIMTLVAATAVLGAAYLIPVPPRVLEVLAPALAERARASLALPGEPSDLAEAERALVRLAGGERSEPAWRPLAADPDGSVLGLVHLLTGLGAFLLALSTVRTPRERRLVAGALALTGLSQAGYGLLEALSGHRHILHVPKVHFPELASGTFVSPNHFAALISMGLFATVGLVVSGLASRRESSRDRAHVSSRLVLLLTVSAVIVLAMVWSSSRAALASAGAGLAMLVAWLAASGARRTTGALVRVGAGALLALALIAAAVAVRPPEPLVEELERVPGGFTSRAEIWSTTWNIIRESPLVGTGPGTYRWLHAVHRPPEVARSVQHAHSDYLEWWSEAGLPGVILAVAWMAVVAAGLASAVRLAPDRFLVASAAAGVAALGLHETVDFALRLPGVLVPLAVLIGALLADVPSGPTARVRPPRRWRPERPLLAGVAALLVLAGSAVLFGHRTIPAGADPTSTLSGVVASAESKRQWARRRIDVILADTRGGREPLPGDVAARAGPAVRALQQAARRAPLRADVRLSSWIAAQTLLSSADVDAAEAGRIAPILRHYLLRAERLSPASRSKRLLLVKYWLLAGDNPEARRVARELLEVAPHLATEVYQLLGGARLGLADLMEATPSRSPAALVLSSYLTRERDDRVGAQIVLERALSRDPGNAELRSALVSTLHARKLHDEALEVLEDGPPAASREDRLARLHLRASLLSRLGQWDRTDAALLELRREGYEPQRVALLTARTMLARGKRDEALSILKELADGPGESLSRDTRIDVLVMIGREMERRNLQLDALESYRRAAELDPDDARVRDFFERLGQTAATARDGQD